MTDHPIGLWSTNNRFLAKALAFAGLNFSVYREYDKEYLDKHKCATIREAEQRNLPGREQWMFEPSDALNKIVIAFDAENDAIDEIVKEGKDIPFCDEQDAETRCREFVRAMRGAKLIDKTLFAAVPYIRIWEDGKGKPHIKKTDKGSVAVWPGSKVLAANASEEIRKHLGL